MRPRSVVRALAQLRHPFHFSKPQLELLEDRCSPGALGLLAWLWGFNALPGDPGSLVSPGSGELLPDRGETSRGSDYSSDLGSSPGSASLLLPDRPIPRQSTAGAEAEGSGERRDQPPAGPVSSLASGPSSASLWSPQDLLPPSQGHSNPVVGSLANFGTGGGGAPASSGKGGQAPALSDQVAADHSGPIQARDSRADRQRDQSGCRTGRFRRRPLCRAGGREAAGPAAPRRSRSPRPNSRKAGPASRR
jgi:hypothetical protein